MQYNVHVDFTLVNDCSSLWPRISKGHSWIFIILIFYNPLGQGYLTYLLQVGFLLSLVIIQD